MSFGWSAGDIVSAVKVLYQVCAALKDSGGAASEFQDALSFLQTLSRTLNNLNALQSTNIDLELATNLREQCGHIRVPLQAFLEDVGRRFDPALGVSSKRNRIFAAPRKIQWATSTSKRVKKLQDRVAIPMAAVGLMLGQQIVQTTLQMPGDIQDRIAHSIDTAINTNVIPPISRIGQKIEDLSTVHSSSIDQVTQRIQTLAESVETTDNRLMNQIAETEVRLETSLEKIVVSHQESPTVTAGLHTKLEGLSISQSTSTDLVVRHLHQTQRYIGLQTLENRTQTSSLHQKLDQVDLSLGAIRDSLQDLSSAQQNLDPEASRSEIQKALQNILGSIWILLSSLQMLIRELVMLLAPYMIVFYRNTLRPLLDHGDNFIFEDALGRIKRLPCDQFQHWGIFYHFLVGSFEEVPGLSLIIRSRFMLMNGYNNVPITSDVWSAVIQPKSRVVMAMILDGNAIKQGRCADPACPGRVYSMSTKKGRVCKVCGKHLSILKEAKPPGESRTTASRTSHFQNILGPHYPENETQRTEILSAELPPETLSEAEKLWTKGGSSVEVPQKDIAAFKRVVWEESRDIDSQELLTELASSLGKGPNTNSKDSGTPLTRSDARSSNCIIKELSDEHKAPNNVSATTQKADSIQKQWGTFWLCSECQDEGNNYDQSKFYSEGAFRHHLRQSHGIYGAISHDAVAKKSLQNIPSVTFEGDLMDSQPIQDREARSTFEEMRKRDEKAEASARLPQLAAYSRMIHRSLSVSDNISD